jgi:hypothetical protein
MRGLRNALKDTIEKKGTEREQLEELQTVVYKRMEESKGHELVFWK